MARVSDHRTHPAAAPTPARQGTIRDANLALLYRLIVDAPAPVSRAALAAVTGMTRATASALADALLAADLVQEVSPPPATGAGRPAAGLVPSSSGPVGLGLEINVDYLAASVVDLAGRVRGTLTAHGDQRGRRPAEVLGDLAELAAQAREAADAPDPVVAGTAVAVPGLVEASRGRIRRAPNLRWEDMDIAHELRGLLPDASFDPIVGNEADFAALAEAHASREHAALTDFLYVSGEIGVGAGIVLGSELFRGARGWAGEIGHVTVEPGGASCRCGARGCLETVAGLEALRRTGPEAAANPLGRAVAGAVNLLDLPAVVLGGVYARPEFAAALLRGVEQTLAEHVVSARWAPVAVHTSQLGETAAARGAAVAVVRRIHADPAGWLEVLTEA
ncbi:ROK family protein [Catenulispora subtropica]